MLAGGTGAKVYLKSGQSVLVVAQPRSGFIIPEPVLPLASPSGWDTSFRGAPTWRNPFLRSLLDLRPRDNFVERPSAIVSDPEILGGTPCFRGTRVPVDSLIDYLEAGDTLNEFLDNFPSVSRESAIAALEEAKALLTNPR